MRFSYLSSYGASTFRAILNRVGSPRFGSNLQRYQRTHSGAKKFIRLGWNGYLQTHSVNTFFHRRFSLRSMSKNAESRDRETSPLSKRRPLPYNRANRSARFRRCFQFTRLRYSLNYRKGLRTVGFVIIFGKSPRCDFLPQKSNTLPVVGVIKNGAKKFRCTSLCWLCYSNRRN